MNDSLGREQFAYRCGTQTSIMSHDAIDKTPEDVYPHQDRLGLSVCWSPMGSYLVTFHKQGIWLRGDADFNKKVLSQRYLSIDPIIMSQSSYPNHHVPIKYEGICLLTSILIVLLSQVSFSHDGVKHIYFSPDEKYLITWDGSNTQIDHDRAVVVWQVFTGKALRAFPVSLLLLDSSAVFPVCCFPSLLFSQSAVRCFENHPTLQYNSRRCLFVLPSFYRLPSTPPRVSPLTRVVLGRSLFSRTTQNFSP